MYQQYATPGSQQQTVPFNGGTYWPGMGGMAYAPRPAPRMTQPVTAELSKMLHESNDVLDIRVKNVDKIKAWCTHKEPGTGRFALTPLHPEDPDSTMVQCSVCGERFDLVNLPPEEVNTLVDSMISVLQTIKTVYLDIPEEFTKQYFMTISLLNKVKELYPHAFKNFATHEAYTSQLVPNNPNVNAWQMANQIIGSFNPFGGQTPYGGYPPVGAVGAPIGAPNQTPGVMPGYGMPPQPPYPYPPQQTSTSGMWAQPPAGAPAVPVVDAWGNVIAQSPAVTTAQGQPMAPGFNPLMATGVNPGSMVAPPPTGPANNQPQPNTPQTNPQQTQQTKQMSV